MTSLRTGILALSFAVVASAACGSHVESAPAGGGGHGTTSTTSTTSTSSTSGPLPPGGCNGDADCPPSSQCVPLTPGGYQMCTAFPPEATACNMPMGEIPDECCTSADCAKGKCYLNTYLTDYLCSGGVSPSNVCVADACSSDADCGQGGVSICAPAGTIGPARVCLPAYCHTNADCTSDGHGLCAPVVSPCCTTTLGLACVYAGGCATSADCGDAGTSVCTLDTPSGTGKCVSGPPECGG